MTSKIIKMFLAGIFIDLMKIISGYKIRKITSCIDKDIKVVAIFSTTALGDFLLNTPSVIAIRQHFNRARIILIIEKSNLPLAEGSTLFDEIILWNGKVNGVISLAMKLKKARAQAAFILHSRSPYDILVATISRCEYIVKFIYGNDHAGRKNFSLQNYLSQDVMTNDKKSSHPVSLIKSKALFLESFGIQSSDMKMVIPAPFIPQPRVVRTVGIHAGASSEERCWNINNFITLINYILQSYHDIHVEITGGHREAERNKKIIAALANHSSRIVNVAGKTSRMQLVQRISSMECLVVGDTGPLHVAIAARVPVIGLFTDYQHSIGFGAMQDQHIHSALFAENGINAIKSEDVIRAVEKVIHRGNSQVHRRPYPPAGIAEGSLQ